MTKLVQAAIEIIKQYSIRLTVRQIYYRLVAANLIKNSRSAYNALDKALTVARLKGAISFNAIEDRSRQFQAGDVEEYQTPEEFMEWRLNALKNSEAQYEMPYWLNQPRYVEVWLEKDALSGLFKRVCDQLHVRLAPCRGYASVSFIYEATKKLREVGKPIFILYFGDFDMRGVDIQRYLEERFEGFGLDVNVERVALARQQVEQYQLPPQPAKKTDTMARGWMDAQGDVAWELDALEPNILMRLLEDAIKKHLDSDVLYKRHCLHKENLDRIREIVEKIFSGLNK